MFKSPALTFSMALSSWLTGFTIFRVSAPEIIMDRTRLNRDMARTTVPIVCRAGELMGA